MFFNSLSIVWIQSILCGLLCGKTLHFKHIFIIFSSSRLGRYSNLHESANLLKKKKISYVRIAHSLLFCKQNSNKRMNDTSDVYLWAILRFISNCASWSWLISYKNYQWLCTAALRINLSQTHFVLHKIHHCFLNNS